jgi:hypothetical protein
MLISQSDSAGRNCLSDRHASSDTPESESDRQRMVLEGIKWVGVVAALRRIRIMGEKRWT